MMYRILLMKAVTAFITLFGIVTSTAVYTSDRVTYSFSGKYSGSWYTWEDDDGS
jgi:hypothetical protein